LAKRLTEKQREEIVRSFKSGIAIDVLSQNYSCATSTIIRNLKKNLGESKYNDLFNKSKSLVSKIKTNKKQTHDLEKTNLNINFEFFKN